MGDNAKRDQNSITTLLGVSSADGVTPVDIWVDPVTHRVLVDGVGSQGVGIASITLTGTVGLVDTYTITYTDASTSTFDVTNGADGNDGADAFVYIAYASDGSGTDFSLTPGPTLKYIAILNTTVAIPSPAVGDFTGLWEKYLGDDGAGSGDVVGPASAVDSNFAGFDTTTGKLIKDSGSKASDFQPAGSYEVTTNKATTFGTINDTLYPTVKAVNDAITSAVVGLLDYRGTYDASTNLFPATGGSGIADAILKGDFWVCSVSGTLGGIGVTAGDLIIALVDTPGQTAGNWDLVQHDVNNEYVTKALYDANTILYATTDNTPVALTVDASTIVGRKSTGDIVALSASETRTILNVADGSTANVKATGAELDTGTDDAKFATAKAIKDSHNVPSVAPSTSGNVLTSNGTDWVSSAPSGGGKTVGTTTSSPTPTIDTDTYDEYILSAQSEDITSMTTNLSGTPTDGQQLEIKITSISPIVQPTFINKFEYDSASSNSALTDLPTNTANGDLIIALVNHYDSYVNSVPAGWTLAGQMTTTRNFELYWKIASSEPANYTWGFSTTNKTRVTLITYRGGFNKTNPISAISNTQYAASDTNIIGGSFFVPNKNSPLLFFASLYDTTATTYTKPTTPTDVWVEDSDAGNTNSDFYNEICSQGIQSSIGYTGNITAVSSRTETAKHAFVLALNPIYTVTWGSSFSGITKSYLISGVTKNYIFEYYNSKWNYMDNYMQYTSGIVTYDTSTATGQITIPHNQGKIPNKVKLNARWVNGDNLCISTGVYNTFFGNNNCVSIHQDISTTTQTVFTSNNYAIILTDDPLLSNGSQQGSVTTDETNIYINFVYVASMSGNAYIMWEAE